MKIEYGTELGVRLLKTLDVNGFVYHLVNLEPQLAQELSDKLAFQTQDNDYLLQGLKPTTTGEHDAS